MASRIVPLDRRSAVFLAVVAFGATGAFAAPQVDLAARVTPTEITVGDPVRYEITVTHPAGARVTLPAVRGNTGALEVLDYAVRTDSAGDGRLAVTHALTLAAYAVGVDTLPPQRVEVRAQSDTGASVLYTPPTLLTVKATAPQDARDIADIHDGERLPRGFPWGLPLLLALLIGGVWAWKAWKKRRAARAALRPIPAPRGPTAAEAALARLEALEREQPVAAGRARAFAFTLSEILREYLAARFGIDALEATTAELLQRAETTSLAPARRGWLREFCDELDAVKFADAALTEADAALLLDEARALVRETAFVADATPGPSAPEPARAPEGTGS